MIKTDETGRQTKEELEEQTGEELPDREVMSIWPVLDPYGPSMLPPTMPAEAPEDAPPE
jgi:hypothetical protein